MPRKYVHKQRGETMKYKTENLKMALQAVQNGSMSIRKAVSTFGVPKSTLFDKKTGKTDVETRPGRKPYIPKDIEDKIVETVKTAAKQGMGISRKQLLVRTGILCKRMQVSAFKNKTPGKDWWEGMKRRHPDLCIRKPEKLGASRASMLNQVVVTKYFNDLKNIIETLNLRDHPERIWNCDETGKQFQHDPVKIIAEKGARNVVSKVTDARTSVTIMACVNAQGDKMPPMMIVKGKSSRSVHGFNTADAPNGTMWSFQEKGWMTDKIGESWFKDVFIKNCGNERPQLLILDGHSSHETLAIIQLAIEENIHLLSLPPHTTHALQPLDRSVFGPLNAAYNKVCSEFLAENSLHLVNKWTFPKLFTTAWEQSVSKENITNGFRSCGIFPFNPAAVSVEHFQPSMPTDIPLQSDRTSATVACLEEQHKMPISITPDLAINNINMSETVSEKGDAQQEQQTEPESTFVLDDPENLLKLIQEGNFEIFTADETGIATIPDKTETVSTEVLLNETETITTAVSDETDDTQNNHEKSNVEETQQKTTMDISDIWNSAIEKIFLPEKHIATKEKKNINKKSTSHRLLTCDDVLEEKMEKERKKQIQEEAKQERARKREMKKAEKLQQNEIKTKKIKTKI